MNERASHWDNRYGGTAVEALTWYQERPDISLELIRRYSTPSDSLIDIGAGASTLVDHLVEVDYRDVTLVDISAQALSNVQERIENLGGEVQTLIHDITHWVPERKYQVWHDRAVFHFLTAQSDRLAYRKALDAGLAVGGWIILGTFAVGGPEKCSGLPICQYDATTMQNELGDAYELVHSENEDHRTPLGRIQAFQWGVFKRLK